MGYAGVCADPGRRAFPAHNKGETRNGEAGSIYFAGLYTCRVCFSGYCRLSPLLALLYMVPGTLRQWVWASASRSGGLIIGNSKFKGFPAQQQVAGYLLLCGVVLTFAALLGLKIVLLLLIVLGAFLFVMQVRDAPFLGVTNAASIKKSFELRSLDFQSQYTYLLLLMALGIGLVVEIVYIRGFLKQAWFLIFALLLLGSSVFLPLGTLSRIDDHRAWAAASPPAQSATYTPTLDGFAFARSWYPGDAQAISWLNENITGSPVILEAAAPVSYAWFNRVSVYTGLPDVLGWVDHEDEQRYNNQPLNRMTDIGIIYTTPDPAQALELLYYYHVRYIYVGELEREEYAQQSTAGLDKFDAMVGSSLRLVYRSNGVTIYEVM